jgi:hypothetical protein
MGRMLTGLGRPAVRCLTSVYPAPSGPRHRKYQLIPLHTIIPRALSDKTLTLEDIEVRLGRTVRLEEGIPPDSTCVERPSARSAGSVFDVDIIRRLTCE